MESRNLGNKTKIIKFMSNVGNYGLIILTLFGENLVKHSSLKANMQRILDKFQMSECKSVSTPLVQNVKLYNSDGSKEADGTLYHQLVGILNYLTTTRLDLSYSVSILS